MSDVQTELYDREKVAKHETKVAYFVMFAGVVTIIFWFVGALWASKKKSFANETRYADHFSNITTTTLASFALMLAGVAFALTMNAGLMLTGSGIMSIALIFVIFRMTKGLIRLLSNKPYHGE